MHVRYKVQLFAHDICFCCGINDDSIASDDGIDETFKTIHKPESLSVASCLFEAFLNQRSSIIYTL